MSLRVRRLWVEVTSLPLRTGRLPSYNDLLAPKAMMHGVDGRVRVVEVCGSRIFRSRRLITDRDATTKKISRKNTTLTTGTTTTEGCLNRW